MTRQAKSSYSQVELQASHSKEHLHIHFRKRKNSSCKLLSDSSSRITVRLELTGMDPGSVSIHTASLVSIRLS